MPLVVSCYNLKHPPALTDYLLPAISQSHFCTQGFGQPWGRVFCPPTQSQVPFLYLLQVEPFLRATVSLGVYLLWHRLVHSHSCFEMRLFQRGLLHGPQHLQTDSSRGLLPDLAGAVADVRGGYILTCHTELQGAWKCGCFLLLPPAIEIIIAGRGRTHIAGPKKGQQCLSKLTIHTIPQSKVLQHHSYLLS